jgi:hypothetical protein
VITDLENIPINLQSMDIIITRKNAVLLSALTAAEAYAYDVFQAD